MASSPTVQLSSLEDLFVDQLGDLLRTEQGLADLLPKLSDAAGSSQLKSLFKRELVQVRKHVDRLRDIFSALGRDEHPASSNAAESLLQHCEQIIESEGDAAVKDAALIAATQRVEHFQIASYGVTRSFAQQLNHHEVATKLQTCLAEKEREDRTLSQLAEIWINAQAARV